MALGMIDSSAALPCVAMIVDSLGNIAQLLHDGMVTIEWYYFKGV